MPAPSRTAATRASTDRVADIATGGGRKLVTKVGRGTRTRAQAFRAKVNGRIEGGSSCRHTLSYAVTSRRPGGGKDVRGVSRGSDRPRTSHRPCSRESGFWHFRAVA